MIVTAINKTIALRSVLIRPLIRSIFRGEIHGGSRLVEEDLAAKLQVSRAPIREALREMATMGLIELRPNRGAVVLPFDPASLRGIYRVRMALESDAVSLAAGKIPEEESAAFRKVFEDLRVNRTATEAWSERAIGSDASFHEMISSHCGIPRLAMEIRRYSLLVAEIRQALESKLWFQEEAVNQHIKILDALTAGDEERAAREMRHHIADATEYAVEALFPSPTKAS